MGIEVKDVATNQTISGQPVVESTPTTETPTVETPTTETPAQTSEGAEGTNAAAPKVEGETPPAAATNVDISPDALRQITALSKTNRTLKTKNAELEAKLAANPDIAAKLERLALLESALGSPRKWLEISKKTLEDVAADTLAGENEVHDPRVDSLAQANQELRRELDEVKQRDTKKETEAQTARNAAAVEQSVAYTKTVIANGKLPDGSLRWEQLSKNETAAKEAVDAAIMIVDRDFREKKDDTGKVIRANKPVDNATAMKILEACLDEAEAMALAREMLEQRKKGSGQPAGNQARSKGLEIREEAAPRETPVRTAKLTIDGSRGATRVPGMERGQTDVRTARARAMRIAGADKE